MTNITKNECIRILESFNWTYTGFRKIGWNDKFYTFKVPGMKGYRAMTLSEMRRKAYGMDVNRWHAQRVAQRG